MILRFGLLRKRTNQPTPDPQVWLKMKEAMKQEVR